MQFVRPGQSSQVDFSWEGFWRATRLNWWVGFLGIFPRYSISFLKARSEHFMACNPRSLSRSDIQGRWAKAIHRNFIFNWIRLTVLPLDGFVMLLRLTRSTYVLDQLHQNVAKQSHARVTCVTLRDIPVKTLRDMHEILMNSFACQIRSMCSPMVFVLILEYYYILSSSNFFNHFKNRKKKSNGVRDFVKTIIIKVVKWSWLKRAWNRLDWNNLSDISL